MNASDKHAGVKMSREKRGGDLRVVGQGDREVVMTRSFRAPRQAVFEAMTQPELIQRWLLGPEGWTMPVCQVDLRVGGSYRYVWRNVKDGMEMGVSGVYREIVPPERIVHTERFDQPWYPGEAVITMVLTETAGLTAMRMTILHVSTEGRDGMLKSGMEKGVAQSYDRLDEILAASN